MKFLIVDDNETSAGLLLNYLKDSGECHVAYSGEEALNTIQSAMETGDPYDVICLDIMMPIIDGIETLRTIRELEQSTFNISGRKSAIIMTSALDDIKTIMRSFKEMCDGYLTKPIKKRDLLDKIDQVKLRTE
ncbi:MAG: response regulator [Desulfopila sp.]|nr:response regulator [Desulfopila sp.]